MSKFVINTTLIVGCFLCFLGCSNNGLNKSITVELSAEDIKPYLSKDKNFENFYCWCRSLGDWVVTDNMRMAKYGSLTYQQMWNVTQELWDINHNFVDTNKIDLQHLSMFPNREIYRNQADSILNCLDAIRPDSLVKLEFLTKTKVGYFSKYYVVATPLKDEVDQFSFIFNFSEKLKGHKSIYETDHPYCGEQSAPINKATIIEVNGGLIDFFERKTTEELKRDFDFLYSIIEVRYKGHNWDDVPDEIRWYLENQRDNNNTRKIAVEVAIKEYIDSQYLPYNVFFLQQRDKILDEIAPNSIELINAYNEYLSYLQIH